MRDKENDLFTIGVVAVILAVFTVADLVSEISLFWREQTPGPEFTMARLLSGEITEQYRENVGETFVNGAKWDKIRYSCQVLLGKRDRNGVYLGKDDTYFARHLPEAYTEEMIEDSLEYAERLAREQGALIMLVPTSDEIWKDRLPLYAEVLDQKGYLEQVKQAVGSEHYVDAASILEAHSQEPVYFRTDTHWTQLGAYYGYHAWWEASGKLLPYYYNPDRCREVQSDFRGLLYRQLGMDMAAESLCVFAETERKEPLIRYENHYQRAGYYREEALESENPYGYFLGDGFGFAQISTGYERSGSLFVIGTDYANAMIPFLAPHYSRIYLVNPRYYEGDVETLARQYGRQEGMEVLVLCSVPAFLEQF